MNSLLLVVSVFIGNILISSLSLGIVWIPLLTIGIILGTVLGLVIYIVYTELFLWIENLSRISVVGKCVLITGCDSGFGFLLAKSLMKRGIFVFAGVLNPASDGAQILQLSPLVKVIKMDITKPEDVNEAHTIVDEYLSETNTVLHAVVNNAGIGHSRMLEFVDIDKLRQLFEINSIGMLRVCQRFSTLLRKNQGRIVNVTSIAGFHVSPFLGAYCASKFAAEAISRGLRIEMYSLRLPVITIQPNAYKTPILLSSSDKLYGAEEVNLYGEAFMQQCQQNITDWALNSSGNFQEVIDSIESAILNEKYQYNYIPGFKNRFLILIMKLLYEKHLVTTGCKDTNLSIPTTIIHSR